MSYFNQFKTFNPLSGEVPSYPFSLLPDIARRARVILKSRTVEQIESMSFALDFVIDAYFETVKDDEISRLRNILESHQKWKREPESVEHEYDEALKYFEWDGGTEANGRWLFKEEMESELGVASVENTSEVDVLRILERNWYSAEEIDPDVPGVGYSDLFATLSLWLLADAIKWLNYSLGRQIKELEQVDMAISQLLQSVGVSSHSSNMSLSGECALKAMDAICYAEHYRTLGAMAQIQTMQREEERKRRSMRAEKLNIARHQKRNEARSKTIEEWEKSIFQFPSAEKAGRHYSDWLLENGFDFEPRTVTGWIRDYAKKIGVRFR